MQRKVFDMLASAKGAVVVVVLLVAGGLLMWGASFANSNVHDQLTQQRIFFPPKGSPELASPQVGPYLNQYAGQQLITGDQAKAYADHFIAVHVQEIGNGKTYAQLSGLARTQPNNAKLQAQVSSLFRGETLRGLLIEAYGFGTFGAIALYAGIVAFVLAAVMLVLVLLGMWHARRVPTSTELFTHAAAEKRHVVAA